MPYDVQVAGTVREATGLPQARNYTVTTTIVPGLTQVNQSVQVAPRGEFRYPWQNLVDLRLTKIFRLPSGVRVEPTVDLFNIFNNNAVTSAVTTVGSSLGRPSAIVMGRLSFTSEAMRSRYGPDTSALSSLPCPDANSPFSTTR